METQTELMGYQYCTRKIGEAKDIQKLITYRNEIECK